MYPLCSLHTLRPLHIACPSTAPASMDPERRSAGVLLHISSLDGPYGIGSLGRSARAFVDFLQRAKQSYWQILPLGPTGGGDSPYSAFSTFAGNPLLIDLESLCHEGLLTEQELAHVWGTEPTQVDYDRLHGLRPPLLRRAFARARQKDAAAMAAFAAKNPWLAEYALYAALKAQFEEKPWTQWPEGLRLRDPKALAEQKALLADELAYHSWVQLRFFRQWFALRRYANRRGISIIGDLPIYMPLDSADCWAHPENYQLDEEARPTAVAGCPPDCFAPTGQLWGNPLYDWDKLAKEGFGWWVERVRAALRLCDVLRLDHFRGFASYYSIPASHKTAEHGQWRPGPGMALFTALEKALGPLPVIAEDLGTLGDDVTALLKATGYPNMKVLQFAFDGDPKNDHLPYRYEKNMVAYTGTHDNATATGWFGDMGDEERLRACRYLNIADFEGVGFGLARGVLTSTAALAVVPMQDYLEMPPYCRMNTPGTPTGNWRWRLYDGALRGELADRIGFLTAITGRG